MALLAIEPWTYFGAEEDDALAALRTRMGTSYTSSPEDADLLEGLSRAVEFLHRATARWFVPRTGTLLLAGTGDVRLNLPCPVVSVDQVETGGITLAEILPAGSEDWTEVDASSYRVNDGALDGGGRDDPRHNPFVEFVPYSETDASPEEEIGGRWPYGVRNVRLTGTFGYLTEAGETPPLILHVLARLTILQLVPLDDDDGQEDKRRGALVSESVMGRSYALGRPAMGAGPTTDREIDLILAGFRRPPRVHVSRPPRRAARRGSSLWPRGR